ncbi:hypothetical protein [Fredinandcohnia quinoae]|uniref:Uncharacterized protein n=1 Tax=Fredinandcohnia quinoae TaxID=2918902 RepID=A0AAW5E405_9BACI|nr:hypothetical protein [Fredinandcohnia sp. SECRCQ15]MCH1624295.1 hypothetical protein [Fredinandcohnia sp. SECRCQ15]
MANKTIGFVFCIIILFVLYNTFRVGFYPDSPITAINKNDILEKLQSSSKNITFLTSDNDYLYYITEFDKGNGMERIIELMENNGYTYQTQEGAGLFFIKDDNQIIISTEMWTKKYMIFKIPSSF